MTDLSRRSLVAGAAALPGLAVPAVAVSAEPDPIVVDPVFAAIERYKAACKVSEADRRSGRFGRDVLIATDAALRELVFMTPTTEEGVTAQQEFFTVDSFCTLPGVRDCLRSVAPIRARWCPSMNLRRVPPRPAHSTQPGKEKS
jgi:hypothetical protein